MRDIVRRIVCLLHVRLNENKEAEVAITKERLLSLKEYLVGTPDRIYSFISVLLGLLSIVLTVFLWEFPEKIPGLIIIRDIIVICVLLLVSGLLLYKYIRRESYLNRLTMRLQASNDRLNKQFSNFHSIVHKYRNDVFQHYLHKIPEEIVVTKRERDTFEKICHSVTMELKRVILDYLESRNVSLKDDLCVTVKLTLSSKNIIDLYGAAFDKTIKRKLRKNQQWVITVYRDPETYERYRENREVGNRIYCIERNTAFIHIFQEREQIFAKDDLSILGDAYKNENPCWERQYNSTLVAPIRYSVPEKGGYRCFGFIAVDSMNTERKNIFETEEAKYIIGHIADLMANYFLTLSIDKPTACATITKTA
jgi:hypothetical protein